MPNDAENKNHDWTAIRLDYVTTRDSLDEVRARHGVDRASITRHSSDEGWVEAREEHQQKVATQRLALLVKRKAKTEAEIDAVVHSAAWSGVQLLTEKLTSAKTTAEATRALDGLEKAYRLLRLTGGLPLEKAPPPPEEKEFVFHALDSDGQDYFESKGKRYYQMTAMAIAAATLGLTPEALPAAHPPAVNDAPQTDADGQGASSSEGSPEDDVGMGDPPDWEDEGT